MFTIMTFQILGSFWEKTVMPSVMTALSVGFSPRKVNDLVNRMLAAEVDWRSMEQLRRALAELDRHVAAQEEELNLYRLLLQQDSSIKGLHIEYWRVTPAAPGLYDYRLVVRQNLDLRESLEVSLKVVLFGEAGGEAVRFTLAELDEGIDREVVPLSFRYFKFFDGRLAIPADFSPREVEISVWPRGKREDARVRRFAWEDGDGEEGEARLR
jgi:hypothetical protein